MKSIEKVFIAIVDSGNSVTMSELMDYTHLNKRTINMNISKMRQAGIPIIYSDGCYKIAENISELNEQLKAILLKVNSLKDIYIGLICNAEHIKKLDDEEIKRYIHILYSRGERKGRK